MDRGRPILLSTTVFHVIKRNDKNRIYKLNDMNAKLILLLLISLGFGSAVTAQGPGPGTQIANRIADKMKDTLGLTQQKRNQVFAINMHLHNRKMIVRQQTTNPDSLQARLQRVEKKRDSMYQRILPPPKYQLYLQKKRNLISSN